MKIFLLVSLLFCSCASIKYLFHEPKYEFCGKIDVLEVYRKDFSFSSCKELLQVTEEAYEILWQKVAGPLNEPWRIEYMWGNISIEEPWAQTDPHIHLIQVREARTHSILHELRHAYMFETDTGGPSHHKTMCADKVWLKIEHDFDVMPYYCHI